jgi:MoaA/NifB/PqqE/SkfB family radical SAM enzyme|tara:strand:+ start:17 stop:685 length:669 start_codon:yes stop_codon:yes gene_type:complete
MIYKYEDLDNIDLEMAVTTHCNARCIHCPRTDKVTGKKVSWLTLSHMKISTFKAIITGQDMIRHIKICGEFGDPLMNPQLKDMIDYVMTTTNITMMINTNGGLRNTSWYKKIAEAYGKRIVIVFGIDGLDHETNWKYREGVEFDKAYNNMLTFHRNGGRVKWQFILFEWNVHQMEEAKKQADDLGIPMIFLVDHHYSQSISDLEIDDITERLNKIGATYRKF